jgi:methionyl-tRNA synthetase
MQNYYLTTPIYYVNAAPHIGHAYTSISVDVLNRYLKQKSFLEGGRYETFFLTGTDEHGQKIQEAAAKAGEEPIIFCNQVSEKFKRLDSDLEIEYDYFIRTTDSKHKTGVAHFWRKLEENGWIYKDFYKGFYSVRDEAYYAESELINGRAPTGAEVEFRQEESYFFKLSKFSDILMNLYNEIPSLVFPKSRLNEVKSFVSLGLIDLSISRTNFSWGIPVPTNENHVIYVWLDALTNYLTALGYGSENMDKYKDFWENGIKRHFVGKDILRFHAVFWPAFLIAEKYKENEIDMQEVLEFFKDFTVVSHGWWENEGVKMSKSLGNAIDPYDLIEKFGVDRVRYFLMRDIPFGGDGDFSEERFIQTTNSDLANNIGNLTQRVMTFIYANCDAKIPPFNPSIDNGNFKFEENYEEKFDKHMKEFEFHKAIEVILSMARFANEYIDKKAPWTLKKEGKIDEMKNCLHVLALQIFKIFKLLYPIMPSAATKGISMFNKDIFDIENPKEGDSIKKPEIIFIRL